MRDPHDTALIVSLVLGVPVALLLTLAVSPLVAGLLSPVVGVLLFVAVRRIVRARISTN